MSAQGGTTGYGANPANRSNVGGAGGSSGPAGGGAGTGSGGAGSGGSSGGAPRAHLFEIAWEVCNQVGGIYQVLRSKVPAMVDRWQDRYAVVGPYVPSKAALEFEPTEPGGVMQRVVQALAGEGLVVHHGRWLVPGNPRALLVDHALPVERLNQVKYELWKDHGIDSAAGDPLLDGVISFGEGVRRLLERFQQEFAANDRRVLAHFHEYMGAMALPMLRQRRVPIATAFTTHATLVGRYIASSDPDFYERLPKMNGDEQAARFNVRTQHAMEKAAIKHAHVFTAVSSVTGDEAASLLNRRPDVVTPNGLSIQQYYAAHEMQTRHAEFKERINLFTMGHFFPSYSFDLSKTLYFFTSGRYEPRNKGFDLCLESLARLNAELKTANLGVTVVFFIITSRPARSINPAVLQARGVLNELRAVCDKITLDVGERLFRSAAAGERLHMDDQVEDYWKLRYKRVQYALRTNRLPPIVTHILDDDASDPVLNQIRYLNLINRPEDPVKVVYHPEFINPVNPLWGVEYEQFVRGCHLGIFPSVYEPWGYTPLESMALGVPAITSDLAGFGRYTGEHILGHDELGLTVLRRRGRTFQDSASDLTARLLDYCKLRRRDRIALRNTVERTSWEFDWGRLGVHYQRAHDVALERLAREVG